MGRVRLVVVSIILAFAILGVEICQHGLLSWQTPALLTLVVFLFMAIKQIQKVNSLIATGVSIRPRDISDSSIIEYFNRARESESEVEMAISSIKDIGQENFPSQIKILSNNHIKESLLRAHEKISILRKNEQEKIWITEGIAEITGLKHKGNDITEYAYQVISSTVKYLKANQGGFFLLREGDGDSCFELLGSYAYGKKKYQEKRINIGEGLIGQVYFEKDVFVLTEVPKDYIKITSGLGEAIPRSICIVPLMYEGKVFGAMEIASFEKFRPFKLEYLKTVGEVVGYNLMAIEASRHTERLLSESQRMAAEVKSHEQELSQNMRELTFTQEQMQSKQREMDAVMASLAAIELDMQGVIQNANQVFLGITGYEATDLRGKPYLNLIPIGGNDQMQYEMMWTSLMSGRTFSGEFRIVNCKRHEVWMLGNFTPLLDLNGKPYKIMVVSMFTTQDKEKVLELQEVVSALKSCFPMAEINPDLTFKSANELFLTELGIKRMDLKKLALKDTFHNGSFQKVERYFNDDSDQAGTVSIALQHKNGEVRPYIATLTKMNTHDRMKRGILILQKPGVD